MTTMHQIYLAEILRIELYEFKAYIEISYKGREILNVRTSRFVRFLEDGVLTVPGIEIVPNRKGESRYLDYRI